MKVLKVKPIRTLWGSSQAFLSPVSCSKTPASMTFPEFQRSDSKVANQGRSSQETTWGKIKGTRRSSSRLGNQPPETRLKECRPCKHPNLVSKPPPWTIAIKLFIKSSWVGTHSFLGQEPAVSPFAWQSNKAILFYFTQNSVSEVWCGTSAERPSFQH